METIQPALVAAIVVILIVGSDGGGGKKQYCNHGSQRVLQDCGCLLRRLLLLHHKTGHVSTEKEELGHFYLLRDRSYQLPTLSHLRGGSQFQGLFAPSRGIQSTTVESAGSCDRHENYSPSQSKDAEVWKSAAVVAGKDASQPMTVESLKYSSPSQQNNRMTSNSTACFISMASLHQQSMDAFQYGSITQTLP